MGYRITIANVFFVLYMRWPSRPCTCTSFHTFRSSFGRTARFENGRYVVGADRPMLVLACITVWFEAVNAAVLPRGTSKTKSFFKDEKETLESDAMNRSSKFCHPAHIDGQQQLQKHQYEQQIGTMQQNYMARIYKYMLVRRTAACGTIIIYQVQLLCCETTHGAYQRRGGTTTVHMKIIAKRSVDWTFDHFLLGCVSNF